MPGEKLTDSEVQSRVDALLGQMTIDEKAGQLTQYFAFPNAPEELARVEAEVRAGRAGSLLFVSKAEEIDRLQRIAVTETRLGIPLLFGFDVIHGFKTVMPVPLALAASFDPAVAEAGQAVAAAEARAIGLHWAFAPMVDIARDPRWGRMIEGAGEDPFLGSVMAAAQVRGLQGSHIGAPGRVIAGPKHLAGYGAAVGGRDYDEVDLSDNAFWNIYLPPFKAAVDAGAGNIMSAYMGLNGVPATGNRWLISKVLRETLGFKGFVVSDAGAVADLATHHFAADLPDAGRRAVTAGVDMEMSPPFGASAYATLPQSLAEGRISIADLDASVRRVLEAKLRMGLFEAPYVDLGAARKVLAALAHRETARVAAERSAVLLRNENGFLPLSRDLPSIAVIGPLADSARDTVGPWIFEQDDAETVTVLAGIRSVLGGSAQIGYAPGVSLPKRMFKSIFEMVQPGSDAGAAQDDDAGIARAVELARASSVAVLVLGEGQIMIGENASRSSLVLPGRQQELLEAVVATGTPVVVLIMTGRPVDLKGVEPDAQMVIWYPGTRGGEAVANLLFGDATPGGKLPYNWPRNIGQVPLPYSRLRSHQPGWGDERYWNEPNTPLYPFGFGLSYTTFAHANLTVSKHLIAPGEALTVEVDVTNAGSRSGDEVVQLYVHQRHGTSARPVRELKGFQRITLSAGETRRVGFRLDGNALAYWSAPTQGWVNDESAFDVYVGSDSTAALTTSFDVQKSVQGRS